jgi:transcriptional regulator with XRE-family HTH domain
MLGAIFVRPDQPVMRPEEVRALRDELGWTQEQLADAVGVSPLEVSAWEAGAVSVVLSDAETLGRVAKRERGERAWNAAGARPCAWGVDTRARIESLTAADNWDPLFETAELLRKHQASCALCRRAAEVEQSLPPVPDLPLPLSAGGFLSFVFRTMHMGARLPAWLRFPIRAGVIGGWLVLLTLVLALLRFVVEPSAGFEPSPMLLLQLNAVFMCWVWASMLWDEVYPSRTSGARFLKAATTATLIVVMAMYGMDPLDQFGVILLAMVALSLIRGDLGQKKADPQQTEQNVVPTTEAGPGALAGPGVEPDLRPNAFRTPTVSGAASTSPIATLGGDVEAIRNVVEAGRYEH